MGTTTPPSHRPSSSPTRRLPTPILVRRLRWPPNVLHLLLHLQSTLYPATAAPVHVEPPCQHLDNSGPWQLHPLGHDYVMGTPVGCPLPRLYSAPAPPVLLYSTIQYNASVVSAPPPSWQLSMLHNHGCSLSEEKVQKSPGWRLSGAHYHFKRLHLIKLSVSVKQKPRPKWILVSSLLCWNLLYLMAFYSIIWNFPTNFKAKVKDHTFSDLHHRILIES